MLTLLERKLCSQEQEEKEVLVKTFCNSLIKEKYRKCSMSFLMSVAGLPSPPSLFCGKVSHSSDSPKEHTSSPTLIVTERENDHVQQTTGTENATIWVQCDNKKCMKWRRLNKNTTDPLPDMWYCSMHPNSAFQSCDVPEEGWQLENKELFIYHGLKPGQLVWARLGKYPP